MGAPIKGTVILIGGIKGTEILIGGIKGTEILIGATKERMSRFCTEMRVFW